MNTYGIPSVTIEQMREVDRIMVEEIGVSIVMMMENASRNIAILARRILGRTIKDKSVIILCGKGNNGGDGLGAARHLLNYGAECHIILAARPSELRADPKIQYQILQKSYPQSLEININNKNEYLKHCGSADLIIDALLGYNLKGNPKEPIASLITIANNAHKPILAVDIPSGLSGDTGNAFTPTIKANYTITLALPKVGLMTGKAKAYVGELYVADLSVPKIVYDKLGLNVSTIFEKEEIICCNNGLHSSTSAT